MPIQVAAHGFEMTESLQTNCVDESREKLQAIALHSSSFTAKWTLSLEHGTHVAHVAWADGSFKGDATVKSVDMYQSIRQCAKKAQEQMKKAHGKRIAPRKTARHTHEVGEKVPADDGEYFQEFDDD